MNDTIKPKLKRFFINKKIYTISVLAIIPIISFIIEKVFNTKDTCLSSKANLLQSFIFFILFGVHMIISKNYVDDSNKKTYLHIFIYTIIATIIFYLIMHKNTQQYINKISGGLLFDEDQCPNIIGISVQSMMVEYLMLFLMVLPLS